MAVNIARARDNIWIFGGAWTTYTCGVVMAKTLGTRGKVVVPPIAVVPVIVGGLVLGNMADMAYGNKLARVTREAEYLMEYDRERFVPPKQAPFHKYYLDDEKTMYNDATPVGEFFPNRLWARPSFPLPPSSSSSSSSSSSK